MLWENHPLTLIMWLAVFFRLIAVVFAKGWGMLDDHFLIIEVAQSWADGYDSGRWLPWTPGNEGPSGHSLFYTGLHYLLFAFFNLIRFTDPQAKMFVVRLLHAALSLLTVYYGYRIAERLSDMRTARLVGLLLAVFWFMPWLSVRNLAEVVPIPLLLMSTWMMLRKKDDSKAVKAFIFAGLIAGLVFSVRYQTIIYAGGMGLVLLFQYRFRQALLFGVSYFFMAALIQGGIDMYIWGRPFAELTEYFRYNAENANNYITGAWYKYLLLLLGIFIPPVSVFLFAGSFKNIKKHLIIFLPTMLFLLFHSIFPNKQERFIITIVPSFIIIGIVGWQQLVTEKSWLKRYRKFIRYSWIFFWVINTFLLFAVSTMYSKKARVEAMTYLHRYNQVQSILLENTNAYGVNIVPRFYLGQWVDTYNVTLSEPLDRLSPEVFTPQHEPRFFLFFRPEHLEERVAKMKEYFPDITFETVSEPGNVDKFLRWINPNNKNEAIYIYRNKKYFPDKME